MELKQRNKRSNQRGTSLIELMIACLVLMVGVAGVVSLIPIAIGANYRNRQQSNSTVIAQMVMEKILSVPAGGAAPALVLSDCTPTTFNISTAGGGAPLLASGDVNFNAAAPAGYSMTYAACLRRPVEHPDPFRLRQADHRFSEAEREWAEHEHVLSPGNYSLDVRTRELT